MEAHHGALTTASDRFKGKRSDRRGVYFYIKGLIKLMLSTYFDQFNIMTASTALCVHPWQMLSSAWEEGP